MRVLLLTPNFYPEKTGIGVSATDSARFIRDLEHEPHVITSVPYYPEWKIPKAYSKKLVSKETVEQIKVWRLLRYVPKHPSSIKRILHELSFGAHAFLQALFIKTDLVICISPPLILGFFAVFISRFKRKPLWFYVQDIQPDAAIRLNMLQNKPLLFVLKAMEKFIYRFSEKVLVLCEEMKDNIVAKGLSPAQIEIVPLAVDTDEFALTRDLPSAQSKFRQANNLNDKFIVIYSGNLGVKQEPQILVEAAKLLKDQSDIFFAIVGDGAEQESVASMIKEYALTNIKLFPLVERKDFADLLCAADILICTMKEEVSSFSVPSKVYTYLAAKRPIVVSAARESAAANLISKHDLGFLIEPGSASDIAKQVLEIKNKPELAKRKATDGLVHVEENYSYRVILGKVYGPLLSIITSS